MTNMNEDPKMYEKQYTELYKALTEHKENSKHCKRLFVENKPSGLCPYLQYFTIDALNKEDVPYMIELNSVYISFSVDYKTGKFEVRTCGHIELSDADKQTDKYKYCCMKSMRDVLVDNGGKPFRKRKFKSAEDIAEKAFAYFETVMAEVEKYTGGYPYCKK